MKGKVKITKISEDDNLITGEVAGTPIANVKFEIYDDSGKLVDTLITKADGIAISKDLVVGKYIVKEKETGEYYEINENDFEVEITKNGEVIEVLGVIKGRNPEHDSYIVRFNDGTIEENVMNCELTFDYHRDKASIETRKELSRIMKLYELSDKEAEELLTASYNYDYEMNEGVVLTNLESIERLFTEEDSEERINPSIKQLKAMAMYIRETKEYYVPFFGYEEYTEKVIDLILNKDETEITKLEFLNEIKDMISHNIMCYSSNYSLEQSKQGYEKEFIRENKKLMLVEQMIKEEKQKEKKKNKEAR